MTAWSRIPGSARRHALGWSLVLMLLGGCTGGADKRTVSDDEQVSRLRARARTALELGQPAEAVGLLEQATQLRANDADLWNDLGLAYEAAGDRQAALRSYESAIRTDPRVAEPHLNLAILLMRAGISGRARTEFSEAVQADPDNPSMYWNYAAALIDVGQPEQAREFLRRALELDPAFGPAHAELGRVDALAGRHGAALESFAAAEQLGVSSAAFHANYGLALLEHGRTAPAEDQLRTAVSLDSTRARTWNHLGVARLRQGHAEAAVQALERAHALAPEDEDLRFNLANTLVQLERFAAAERLLHSRPPKRADLLGLWGMALRGLGRGRDARQVLARAAERAPRDTNILNNYGVVLAENGDVPAALEIWTRVLGLEPRNETARANILARGGELPESTSGKD